jgi:hypothetical protein
MSPATAMRSLAASTSSCRAQGSRRSGSNTTDLRMWAWWCARPEVTGCHEQANDGAGWERLSDQLAIGVLTGSYPRALVDQVVAASGRTQRRQRLLPARVVVCYVLAMCLFSQVG